MKKRELCKVTKPQQAEKHKAEVAKAWDLAVNPAAMQKRMASISQDGWLVLKELARSKEPK